MARITVQAAFAGVVFSLLAPSVSAQASATVPASTPATTTSAPKAIQTLGCYSKPDPLTKLADWTWQSSGWCQGECAKQNKRVMAITEGTTCYCGDEIPAQSNEVSSDNCNSPCDGFDQQFCGGHGFWQVYLTGLGEADVADADSSSGSSTTAGTGTSSTSNQPSVVTKAGETVIVTAKATAVPQESSGSSGPSKIGIAIGVVVGLLAVAAIVGCVVLFLKRRRKQAIEEDHRRNTNVKDFVAGGKSSETSSTTDQRLDPSALSQHRASIGSIADERDFSRRILQVRNPDRESRMSNMA